MSSIEGFQDEVEVTSHFRHHRSFYSGWLPQPLDEGGNASPRMGQLPPTTRLQLGLLATLFALLLIDVEGKRGVHIPDDLSAIHDAGEDAAWLLWGEGGREQPKIQPIKQTGEFATMAMCVVTLSVQTLKERRWTLDGCVACAGPDTVCPYPARVSLRAMRQPFLPPPTPRSRNPKTLKFNKSNYNTKKLPDTHVTGFLILGSLILVSQRIRRSLRGLNLHEPSSSRFLFYSQRSGNSFPAAFLDKADFS